MKEDRSIRPQLKASRKSPLGGFAQRRLDLPPRDTLGTQPRRKSIECAANLIKFANPLWVNSGNHQTTPARFLDQLLLLEQLQCMADRLSRDTERATELLLPDALPRGERPIGNCLDQSLVGAIDQGGLKSNRLHQARSEFGIPYCQSKPEE
jgi:hypothetical protein